MRIHNLALVALSSLAILGLSSGARAQTPLLSGTAGSGSNAYFFVMDFRDFATPQSYAFKFLANATTETFEQILNGLAPVPTFSTLIAPGTTFGDSLNGLTYAAKTKFNDFNGHNSGEPNGYWSQWNSSNGVSWLSDNVGITNQSINAGQYVGASWLNDFNNTAVAPRTPFAIAAAPEPGTASLLLFSFSGVAAFVGRRRRKVMVG